MNYIQRKRTRGWKMPPNTKYCGRPGYWGNDAAIGEWNYETGEPYTADEAVEFYRRLMDYAKYHCPEKYKKDLEELARFDALSCWCKPGDPCHVQDVLIPLVEKQEECHPEQ